MKPVEIVEREGYTVEIFQEEEPMNPREWDNLGEMLCVHRRYILGDSYELTVEEIIEIVDYPDIVGLPLYLYDHSGLWMRTRGFEDVDPYGRDWGQVGFIVADFASIREEFGWKRITRGRRERVKAILQAEVETYNQYLTGDVYWFESICSRCGAELDSCGGFYGQNWDENGLLHHASASCSCSEEAV